MFAGHVAPKIYAKKRGRQNPPPPTMENSTQTVEMDNLSEMSEVFMEKKPPVPIPAENSNPLSEPSTEVFAEKKTAKTSVPTTTEHNNPEPEPSSEKKHMTKKPIPITTDYSAIVPELSDESSEDTEDDEAEPQNIPLMVNPILDLISELSAEIPEDEDITPLSASSPSEITPEIPAESPKEEVTGRHHKKILNKEEAKKHLRGIKATKASGWFYMKFFSPTYI